MSEGVHRLRQHPRHLVINDEQAIVQQPWCRNPSFQGSDTVVLYHPAFHRRFKAGFARRLALRARAPSDGRRRHGDQLAFDRTGGAVRCVVGAAGAGRSSATFGTSMP